MRLLHVTTLTAVWVVLWGSLSPATVLSGIGLALGLRALRPSDRRWRIHPSGVLRLLQVLAVDLWRSNVAMAEAVVKGPDAVEEHLVEVPLRRLGAPLDGVVDLLVTLTPGSIAVGLARQPEGPSTLTVHVLETTPTSTAAAVHRLEDAVAGAITVVGPTREGVRA